MFTLTQFVNDFITETRRINTTIDNRYGNRRKAIKALNESCLATLIERGYPEKDAKYVLQDCRELMSLEDENE